MATELNDAYYATNASAVVDKISKDVQIDTTLDSIVIERNLETITGGLTVSVDNIYSGITDATLAKINKDYVYAGALVLADNTIAIPSYTTGENADFGVPDEAVIGVVACTTKINNGVVNVPVLIRGTINLAASPLAELKLAGNKTLIDWYNKVVPGITNTEIIWKGL